MTSSHDGPAFRLLTRLFVRRLLDNDLISPHADRHESLAVVYALVLSVALFVTFFVSAPYLSAYIQLPGPTALSAIPDRFLFVAASMAMCALAALLAWDALTLEPRDTAILGPLPIRPWTITRAKLVAVLVFGAACSVAVNVVPAVLYPVFLTVNLRGISGGGVLRLIAAQAITVVMAGLLGFFAVLAVQALLRLGLAQAGFRRVSSVAQSALVVSAVTALLVTPTLSETTIRNWLAGVEQPRWPAVPVLWHLGMNETLAGDIVVETPVVMPRRLTLRASLRQQDEDGRSAYRALAGNLRTFARGAWLVLPLVPVVAIAAFLWNNRRLPEESGHRPAHSRTRAALRAVGTRLLCHDPEVQAGFFFTLQALTRSGPHRMILAVWVAAALTLPFVTLIGGGASWRGSMSSAGLHPAIMVTLSLMAGFRYAVTVPAELASNWSIQLAWRGDERRYLAGVKRAGILLTVALPLLLLFPLHIALFGVVTAVAHSTFVLLFGAAALEALFLGYRKVPFACSYLPPGDPKLLWPGGAALLLLLPYAFALVERLALQSVSGAVALGAALGGSLLVCRIADWAQRRERLTVNFDEAPAPATQRLGLFDRMAIHD